MFKGLRQKIGQGLASTPARGVVPHALQEASPIPPHTPETQQNVSPRSAVSEDDRDATPCGSLINLNDHDSNNASLQQEQIDSLIDLSINDSSGPAVLEISGSGSHVASDIKSPHDRATRSRTSSVSSQASDSFFMSVPTFPSRQLPLPSDVESITSEAEDGGLALDNISKEELYRCYSRMQQRSTKYRWKFSQVLKTYQEMEKERDKLRDTMTKSQDKAFRRISELKEQIQLDQLAKFDLEQNYVMMLEEKDEVIKVLRTQVSLLKQGKEVPDEITQRVEGAGVKSAKTDDNSVADYQNEKIARMSALLRASKDSITKNREQVQKLNADNVRLMESIETSRIEKERLESAAQKKDQDVYMLVEKLKSELLKLKDQQNEDSLKVPDLSDSSLQDQLEHHHRALLSRLALLQLQYQTSQEQLVTKEAENQKLHSENERLLEEIAEQKRALEKSLLCGTSVDDPSESPRAPVEQNICLCSKHRRYVMPNILSTNVGEEIVTDYGTTESNQITELSAEFGAGEFLQHHDLPCAVCEKEAQLVLANEKIRSSHDRIRQLEEMVNRLRLECEPNNGRVDEAGQPGNRNHDETDGDERDRTALKLVEENHGSEVTCLKEKIDSLEKQLQDVNDSHRLKTDDADRRHQVELEELRRRFDAESEQMSLSLSKELENLKEEVTQLEKELLRQQEANELSEKSAEAIKTEMDDQKCLFETRLATIREEKRNLEIELHTAGGRNQIVTTALKDVQKLKASLVKSVQEIVKRTIQEERGLTGNTEDAADGRTDEVRQSKAEECDLYLERDGEDGEAVTKMQAGDEQFLTDGKMEEGSSGAAADFEEIQNKNDQLHLLLQDWQGCVQLLKNCLQETEAQKHALEADLQQLKAQLFEDNDNWQTRMKEMKELHKRELSYIEEEIKSRISNNEMQLAGNDEKWETRVEEVKNLHTEELNDLKEEIRNLITSREAELAGNEDIWKAKLEEVKELNRNEFSRLEEDFKKQITVKDLEISGNDEKWQARMEELEKLNKEVLNRLEEEFKQNIATNETELAGIGAVWKGQMEEVVLLHKEELIRLDEDFKNQIAAREGEFALENEKWKSRIEEVEESYKVKLNRMEEEVKGLNTTKEAELVGNDDKWKVKMEEVTTLHKEELNRFEADIKKLIAARGLEFALDDEKWQGRLEEATKRHKEEVDRMEEEKRNLVAAKEREFADLQTTYKDREDVLADETEKLRNDLAAMEGRNSDLSDQLNVSEKQIENLLLTMHDLKNLRDTEEDNLRHDMQDSMEKVEEAVESRIQLLNGQKDVLQEQLQELKQDYEEQLENLRSRNEDLASELRTVKVQEDKLLEEVRELELMNKKLEMQHVHNEKEMKFLQERLTELNVRRAEMAEGEKSLSDKLWLAEEQCTSAESQMEKLKNQESTLKNEIQELLVQGDSDKKAFQLLQDENGELRNELTNLKEQGNSSKKLQKALKVLKDRNESLSQHVKELEEERNCTRTELQEMKDQHGFVCKQAEESEEQRSRIEKDLQKFTLENDLLNEQMKALEDQKDGLLNELLDFNDKNGSLNEQVKTLKKQRDVSQNELLEHKDKIVSLCGQIKEAEEQKESICGYAKELEGQHKQTLKELHDLKAQLVESEAMKQSTLQEIARQESKISEEADILRAQVTELSTLSATLENQLKQSEADSAAQKNNLEEELEKMKAEAEMRKEVVRQSEEKLKDLHGLTEVLSSEKTQKDGEIEEVRERLAETEKCYREELFELRKKLCALLNPEMSLVHTAEGHADEMAVLRTVVETELSSHLLRLNTRMDVLSRQSDDAAGRAAELTEQLNAAEKKRHEEELVLKTEQSELEVRNGELRSEIDRLNILVGELQDQASSFAMAKAVCDETVSEKDRLLKEAEEKQTILSQESDLKQTQLLGSIEELQGKVAMLSDQNKESEKTADACSQASQQRLSELTELLTKSENSLRDAETKIETLSAEREAERARLTARFQELSVQNANVARIIGENTSSITSMEERLRRDADEHERLLRLNENLQLDFDALQENLSTKTDQIIEFESTLVKKDVLLKEVEEDPRRKTSDSEQEIERLHVRVKELEDLLTHAESDAQETVRKTNENIALESDKKLKDFEELYKVKVEQLEGVVLSRENKVQALTESLLDVEKIKDTLEAENERLKIRIAEQLQNVSATHENLLEKIEIAYNECRNKETDILELRKTNEEKGNALSELQAKLTAKEEETEKMRLQVIEAKLQMGLANDELQERTRMESEEQKSQIDRLQAENDDQRAEMDKVISENEVTKSEIDRLKIEIDEHQREMNTVHMRNEETLSELNESKVKNDEQKCEIGKLTAANEELNNEIDELKGKIMELETERSDLILEKDKAIEEKDAAWKELEEKLLERSESETTRDEEHRKEIDATELRLLDKIRELQRKFVLKLKAVQNEHEKILSGVKTENEELRLSKSAVEMQLENMKEAAEQHLRTVDELKVKVSELEKSQSDAIQESDDCIVEEHQEVTEERSHEVFVEQQSKGEPVVNSGSGTDKLSDQVLDVSNCNANIEKQQLENAMVEMREQLKQAENVEKETQSKLEKSEETVTELSKSIDVLKEEIEELKLRSAEELKRQTERLEAECSEKLGELKKKAEMRLKQIKNQIQTGKDSSVAELIKVQDDLTEQLSNAKRELECRAELLLVKENEIQKLNVQLKNSHDKLIEETRSLRKAFETSEQQLVEDLRAKENVLEELKGKYQSVEDEAERLRQTIDGLKEEGRVQTDKLATLETNCKGLKKQLVSAKRELDRVKGEKDVEVRAAQLDKETEVARLLSEYKDQLKDFEIDNNSRIKQLVKDFQQKLAEKENEFQSTYMESVEKGQREEDKLIHQHKLEVKSMRMELREKEESFEESIEQMEVQLQAAEMQLDVEKKKSSSEIELLKQSIERLENELLECQCANVTTSDEQPQEADEHTLEKVSHASQLGASVSDSSAYINEQLQQDVIDLTRQIEELKIRYSLQVIKDQAIDNTAMTTEDGTETTTDDNRLPIEQNQLQTLELHNMDLQAQVVQQCGDVARLKIRERSLQHEIEVLKERLRSRTSESSSPTNELSSTKTESQPHIPAPTELQYLKNVLLKFMTGTEQQTLARVICTVLKFSEEETQAVMNHLYNEMF